MRPNTQMKRATVFVDEINAAFIAKTLPQVAAELRTGTPASSAELAAARAEGEQCAIESERRRIAAIAALPGVTPEVITAAATEGLSVDAAARRLLQAGVAAAARHTKRGAAHLAQLRQDEQELDAPSPDTGNPAPTEAQSASAAVALARRLGVIP